MGEGGEKKKPSSLRTRVARSRQTYGRKKNPMPMVIGFVVLAIMGIGLYVFLGRTPPKKYKPPDTGGEAAGNTSGAAAPAASSSGPPRREGTNPKQKAYYVCFYELDDVKAKRKTAEAAVSALKGALSAHPEYTPEIYFTMAMAIDKKIARTPDKSAQRPLYQQKLDYLKKAEEAANAGKKWANGIDAVRNSNLAKSIEQATIHANKYPRLEGLGRPGPEHTAGRRGARPPRPGSLHGQARIGGRSRTFASVPLAPPRRPANDEGPGRGPRGSVLIESGDGYLRPFPFSSFSFLTLGGRGGVGLPCSTLTFAAPGAGLGTLTLGVGRAGWTG
jgi:hypothetical protein